MSSRPAGGYLVPAAAAGARVAYAQEYPLRPVRIVTATRGGGNDYLARIVARG